MNWTAVGRYLKARLLKRGDPTSGDREDKGLPLGARIGGTMRLQLSPFIRARAGGGLVEIPGEPSALVVAISRLRITDEGAIHRYYTEKGDSGDDAERFLQVFTSAKGDVLDILHCTRIVRFIPESVEAQQIFTGEDRTGLGSSPFEIYRSQLIAAGVNMEIIQTAFGESDTIAYTRAVGSAELEFFPPLRGTEERIDDSEGISGLRQHVYYMPYVRDLSAGGQEFLIVTTEVLEERDGKPSREIHVDFAIGLTIERERVSFQ